MKSPHYTRIENFMKLAGQNTPDKPTIPPLEIRKLRARLILEEVLETIEALGLRATVDGNRFEVTEHGEPNLVEIADGCADISVVTIGTLIACGIHDERLLEEVDLNNLAKFGPGHEIREDGKLVKPKDHQPPDITGILERQAQGV